MGLKTGNTGKSTRQKIVELREKHQELFDKMGLSDAEALFFPKMAYLYSAGNHKVISFFPSEIGRGQDIYTEFVSRDYNPEDPDRTLWKWNYNSNYEDEYPTTDPHPVTGDVRYEIPITELVAVGVEPKPEEEENIQEDTPIMNFDAVLPDASVDLPISEMTICDYAAIHLNKPVSRKEWLNDIINK